MSEIAGNMVASVAAWSQSSERRLASGVGTHVAALGAVGGRA
jgi:hypothetical protein